MSKTIYLTLFILLLPSIGLSNQKVTISIQKLEEIFKKNCQQKIESNFSIGNSSNNTNICKFVYMGTMLKNDNKALSMLSSKLNNTKSEIQVLKKYQSLNKTTIEREVNKFEKSKKELLKLKQKNKTFQEIFKSIKKELRDTYTLTQENKTILNNWLRDITDNSDKINLISDDINILDNQLKSLEHKVIQNEFEIAGIKSNFKEYLKKFDNHFFGIYLKGLDNEYLTGGIEHERYNPENQSSFVGRLSYGHLNNEVTYSTLSGIPKNNIKDENTIALLEIGVKKFIPYKLYKLQPYGEVSTGYMFLDEETLIGTFSLGLEFKDNRDSDKIFLEIGVQYLDSVSQREVSFNPLGESKNGFSKTSKTLNFVSLKYLWRW